MHNIVVVGHSHMVAVQGSYSETDVCGRSTTGNRYRFIQLHEPRFAPALHQGVLNATILTELRAAPFEALVSMIAGNDHAVFGLVNHPVKFDFILPERPDLPIQPGAEILPFTAILRQLEKRTSEWTTLLAAFREATDRPVYHVESPPPAPSEEHIKRYPGVFADKIKELGVAPAALRYKLWRAHSLIFRKICLENGIEFIPAPAAMRDQDDMMVREAWNPDPTHGNGRYGMHVRMTIDAHVAGGAGPARSKDENALERLPGPPPERAMEA